MTPQILLQHFDRIGEAPDAIPRLRRFILDLAVRGKLVEQDPREEPASELLKRIHAEKALLARKRGGKKQQVLQIEPEEVPFDIPGKWEWVRLGELGLTQTGTTPSKNHGDHFGNHIPFIKPGDLYPNNVDYANEGLSATGLQDSGRIAPGGSLLMVCIGTIGKCQLIDRDCSFNQQINSLSPYGNRCSRYLLAACLSEYFQKSAWEASARTTIAILNKGKWELLLLPLPPLAEQHRIVAKVDELMALCDRLEAAQSERESRRDRLVASSLHRLNNGADPAAFQEHARFYFNHLPRLTTRRDHIKQLRQTILNLAVRGKLVPQDPTDEPASELLKRIQAEKVQLVKEGTPVRKKLTSSEQKYLTFDSPMNWQAVNFNDVCNLVTSGSRGWAEFYSNTGPKFIRAQNIRFGRLRLENLACVRLPKKIEGTRTQVSRGDLLIVITGAGVTNPALLDHAIGEAYVSQHVALIKPTVTTLSQWLLLCLMAPAGGRAKLVECAYGAGKPGLNLDNIRSLTIPLPPLAEQHRIVAKVDELMALCDQLETQLTTTQFEGQKLMEAILGNFLTA